MTEAPARTSSSATWLPMKPAAPVTSTRRPPHRASPCPERLTSSTLTSHLVPSARDGEPACPATNGSLRRADESHGGVGDVQPPQAFARRIGHLGGRPTLG